MRGNKKTIGFDNCERYFAKSSFGIKGNHIIPELDGTQPNDFLTRLFEQANKNIQDESKIFEEERKQYQEFIITLNPLIENMTLANVIEAIKTAPPILTSEKEAKSHFSEKIKELNLVWNKEKQQYESKQEVQQ